MGLRFKIAMLTGKLAMAGMELLGRRATYLPGKIAIKICPDFMGYIEKPATVIGVTGTNGKTTVCNLLVDALEGQGQKVLGNRFGSNINAGVASSLIKGSTVGGKARYELAVFELDERSAPLIYPYLQPTYLVCLDLFRDSVKRNAHAEYISDMLTSYIPPQSRLILPADDLIAARIAPGNERVYFGIERQPEDLNSCINHINDVRICPECRAELQYDFVRYHHIGRAHCPACGFHSPQPQYAVTAVQREKQLITVLSPDGSDDYHIIGDSIFNISNELAVITVLSELGWQREMIAAAMDKLNIVDTRYQSERVADTEIILHMAKGQNPVACSRVCDYVAGVSGSKQVILMLDDVFDARDTTENICWIYETDFDFLNQEDIKRIVIGGVRARDYYLRLLLAGIPQARLAWTEKEIDSAGLLDYSQKGGKIFILYELYAYELAQKVRDAVKDNIGRAAQ